MLMNMGRGPGRSRASGGAIYSTTILKEGWKDGKPLRASQATVTNPKDWKDYNIDITVSLKPGEKRIILTHYVELNFPNRGAGKASYGCAMGTFLNMKVDECF